MEYRNLSCEMEGRVAVLTYDVPSSATRSGAR